MRFLRHKNGKKARIDETSEACVLSRIENSRIFTQSSVWTSAVIDSDIRKSTIAGAVIENSVIVKTLVTGGHIKNSKVFAELVADHALIIDSEIFGASRIAHTARVENCRIKNFTVTGDAHLKDWPEFVDGQEAYISCGVWERPPRILRLDGGLTITESIPGKAYCGCRQFTISHWLKIGDRYGKTLGLSKEEVQQIREFLHTLI